MVKRYVREREREKAVVRKEKYYVTI